MQSRQNASQHFTHRKDDSGRAGITAIAIIACKALIIDPSNIEIAGVKLVLAKPYFLTGTLGLLLVFFILSALRSTLVEHHSIMESMEQGIVHEFSSLPGKAKLSALIIITITNTLSLLFVALISCALWYSFSDMLALLKTVLVGTA